MNKDGKPTEKEYRTALEIVDRYEFSRKVKKLPQKEGIKYIRCQHLIEKTQMVEQYAQWAGDTLRFIFCPICAKTHMGNALAMIFAHIRFSDPEIRDFLMQNDDNFEHYKQFNETEENLSWFKKIVRQSKWARRIFPANWFDFDNDKEELLT